MPIPIQGLIFDYGNVLCLPQSRSDLQSMAAILRVPEAEFEPVYWSYRMVYDATGIEPAAYWEQVASDLGSTLTPSEIEQLRRLDVDCWSTPNTTMIAFAEAARAAGLRTAILSNMPMDLRLSVAKWLPAFDHSTYSCDVRTCKPGPEIYQHCLEGLAIPASQALFLDDRPENVEAAQRAGIHSFVFTTAEDAAAVLARDYALPVRIEC
jgi:putative hydrolase of the HAD superfamily